MSTRGGKRRGAGRPYGTKSKSTLQAIEMRRVLICEVEKEFKPLVRTLVHLAKGKAIIKNGAKKYTTPPNIGALQYLFNQVIGRATERLEIQDEPSSEVIDTKKATKEEIDQALMRLMGR